MQQLCKRMQTAHLIEQDSATESANSMSSIVESTVGAVKGNFIYIMLSTILAWNCTYLHEINTFMSRESIALSIW